MLAVSLWKTGTQNFIQAQSLFTNVLINIVGYLDWGKFKNKTAWQKNTSRITS